MTFDEEQPITRTPTRVRKLKIIMYKSLDENDSEYPQGMDYEFTVDDQNNEAMNHYYGNLIPQMTPAQISAAQTFFNQMWDKATEEVIP